MHAAADGDDGRLRPFRRGRPADGGDQPQSAFGSAGARHGARCLRPYAREGKSMLRRLGVGVVVIATLGLVTAGTAGAQGYGAPPGTGPGVGPGLSQGMGPMGPGMGPMGPGMGPMGQGTPGDIDLSMMPR